MNYNKQNSLYENLVSPSGSYINILNEYNEANNKGLLHILYTKYLYSHGLSTNIVIPYLDNYNSKIRDLVIINNSSDAERITEKHLKKTPYLKSLLYDSIISTTDVDHWISQRKHFQSAFSLENELKKIIPISNKRAKLCVDILKNIPKSCDSEYVNIYEFFLNETMAQLQLALFGFSNEFQKKTNYKIRKAFHEKDPKYAREFAISFLEEIKTSNGPLSVSMRTRNQNHKSNKEEFGNALIFPFAGHDTTANTLTMLIYEICKNDFIFKKLQSEVDIFWLEQSDPNIIEYDDLKKLKYMTRCIMESLRLWTSIPNGTFRQLTEDEYIIGKLGQQVKIPSGTYIQVPNWTRHRNPELWGKDVNKFNPDRDFKDEEIYNNSGLNSYNPNSHRFSPFTYGPRDCIGKNFSQIEMRIILLHLIKNFTFTLPTCQKKKYDEQHICFNDATLGPRNIFNNNLYDKKLGMYINIIPRTIISKL